VRVSTEFFFCGGSFVPTSQNMASRLCEIMWSDDIDVGVLHVNDKDVRSTTDAI
jgi:hypothetical protein